MRLNSDQELRRELLLFSLSKQSDLEAAIRMATQMERFVLHGHEADAEPATAAADDSQVSEDHTAGSASQAPGEGTSSSGQECTVDRPHAAEQTGAARTRVTKRRWSADDDDLLRRRWRSDRSLETIAEELDRTVASLYSRARALGMPKREALAAEIFADAVAPRADAASRAASCQHRRSAVPGPTPGRQMSFSAERRLPTRRDDRKVPGSGKTAAGKTVAGKTGGASCGCPVSDDRPETGVEPIIHFLRSRDYSVVRVEEGRFRLDGRHILSVDELREKANQVRKTLGQPLFGAASAEPVGSP